MVAEQQKHLSLSLSLSSCLSFPVWQPPLACYSVSRECALLAANCLLSNGSLVSERQSACKFQEPGYGLYPQQLCALRWTLVSWPPVALPIFEANKEEENGDGEEDEEALLTMPLATGLDCDPACGSLLWW